MLSDLSYVLVWWFSLFGIGLIFWPVTRKLFGRFFDQGYLFAKVLGILFSSYLVWLLATLKILPFYQETILLILTFGFIANLLLAKKEISDSKPKLAILVAEELMFLVGIIIWSFVRGLQPDIQGLEKFMDFGFVNSILRSRYFPPVDMWFAGKSINYYYFGHFITAFLTKLTGINSAVTYNLMIATLFSFCFSLTFSLTGNLIYLFIKEKLKNFKLIIIGGLISAFLISLGANLHPAFYNFKMGVLKKPYCDGAYTYWYPNATRYIGYCPAVEDKTIHEFPAYSFIVSDLHGHVSDIPFVFLFLALTLNIFLAIKEGKLKTFRSSLFTLYLPISLVLAVMFMTNQWDFPIYLLVLGFTLLAGFYRQFGKNIKTFTQSVITGGLVVLLSIPFILPFQFNFEPITKGIGLVRAHSLPHQLLILWGTPWFFGLTFLAFLYRQTIRQSLKKEAFVLWFSRRMGVRVQLSKEKAEPETPAAENILPDIFILILFLVSTILIIIPEIIYVKDIYIPSYHRANTMFKLTYQSFVMFSVGIGYIFVRVLSSIKKGFAKKLLVTCYLLLVTCLMVYPHYSIRGYYGSLSFNNYKGLYGLKFLQRLYLDDYSAVLWLNENIKRQPVVLEAVGDSYTDYERISMATGLPTIEGWLVHEWLWRGGYDEPGKRATEVQTIYESGNVVQTKELLGKYEVKYLIIGEMERQKYPNINEEKLESLGEKVYESGKTKILKLF